MSVDFDKYIEELQASIMEDVRRTYTEKVVEHWMHPRNLGRLKAPDGYGKVTGSCGDTMEIFLKVKADRIAEIRFLTDGCGTSIVCGSQITELVREKTVAEAGSITHTSVLDALGGLPEEDRHCALLASDTLKAALADYKRMKKDPWKKFYRVK
jgi:nitrogen fixation NifU-like protein